MKMVSVLAEDSAAVVNQSRATEGTREILDKSSSCMREPPQLSSTEKEDRSNAVGTDDEGRGRSSHAVLHELSSSVLLPTFTRTASIFSLAAVPTRWWPRQSAQLSPISQTAALQLRLTIRFITIAAVFTISLCLRMVPRFIRWFASNRLLLHQ